MTAPQHPRAARPRPGARSSARWPALLLLAAVAACSPRVIPAGPPVGEAAIAADALVMRDGARLPLRAWLPEGPPRAVVLGLHGFGDTARNAFEMPGPGLAAAGVALYAYDQRGFGEAPHPGIWSGSESLLDDLRASVRLLRARHPGAPLLLMGESMGAALLLDAALSGDPPPAEGYVLLAPALRGRASMTPFLRGALEVLAHSIPIVGFRNAAPGFAPTDNPEAMRRWAADPGTLKEVRVDALWGLVNQMDRGVAAVPSFRAPALILYGERDRLITGEPVRDALRALPAGAPHRVALYPEGHHLLLRDLGRGAVLRDILSWIDDPSAPLPSGADRRAQAWLAGAPAAADAAVPAPVPVPAMGGAPPRP